MTTDLTEKQRIYADLILRVGINLQTDQSIWLIAELAHREFVRLLVATAYDQGARYVHVEWLDPLIQRVRFQHADPRHLDYVPEIEVAQRRERLDDRWASVYLTGSEYPDALEDVDPVLMRRERQARIQKVKFFQQAMANFEFAWTMAAVPTTPWARKIFPDMAPELAVERLWQFILQTCRVNQPDPIRAWVEHDARLKKVAAFMNRHQVRSIRYLDESLGLNGKALTDLTVGLTDRPNWAGGSARNRQRLSFFPNIPTEEIYSTPHNQRTHGWVRTSKPDYSFEREVSNAYFRFENGEAVEWRAEKGQDVLDQLFHLRGARRLGELALVDLRSPIHQSGLIFYDTLFDENAACHIAFGKGYAEGVKDGHELSQAELEALGVNDADTHIDLMIGTETMKVTGTCADGREVLVMQNGMFVPDVVA